MSRRREVPSRDSRPDRAARSAAADLGSGRRVPLLRQKLGGIVDPMLDDPQYADGLSFVSAAAVIEALKARALLFDVGEEPGPRYRSRMAEAVRLFFRLAPTVPAARGLIGWQSAPTLVADFRFIWRRRRYPRRGISAVEGLTQLGDATSDGHARQAIAALIESYGPEFALADFQVEAASRILGGFERQSSTATLVSAGTGSGKTLAFYFPRSPGSRRISGETQSPSRWVKVLAALSAQRTAQGPVRRGLCAGTPTGRLAACARPPQGPDRHFFRANAERRGDRPGRATGWRRHRAGWFVNTCGARRSAATATWCGTNADRTRRPERLVLPRIAGSRSRVTRSILTRSPARAGEPRHSLHDNRNAEPADGRHAFRHLFGLGDRGAASGRDDAARRGPHLCRAVRRPGRLPAAAVAAACCASRSPLSASRRRSRTVLASSRG